MYIEQLYRIFCLDLFALTYLWMRDVFFFAAFYFVFEILGSLCSKISLKQYDKYNRNAQTRILYMQLYVVCLPLAQNEKKEDRFFAFRLFLSTR